MGKWSVSFGRNLFSIALGFSVLDFRNIDGTLNVYFDMGFYTLVLIKEGPIECEPNQCCGGGCHG